MLMYHEAEEVTVIEDLGLTPHQIEQAIALYKEHVDYINRGEEMDRIRMSKHVDRWL